MSIADSLLPEFDHEIATTRRMVERVPDGKSDWRPHPKSMPLGRIATHLSEIPTWAVNACTKDELDFAPPGETGFQPQILGTTTEILMQFDTNAADARKALAAMSDTDFMRPWTLKMGGEPIFTMPKISVVRTWVMNHMIHHRGQLSVFLRLLDVPVPATYGPSADEKGG